MSNPFFQPSSSGIFLQADLLSYEQKSQNVNFPAQGAITGGGLDIQAKSAAAELLIKYAFTDYFIVGASGKYMYNQNNTQTGTGILVPASSSSSVAGFYDPGISLIGRFLGTEREDFFLDVEGRFKPGIEDSNNSNFSVPNNAYQGTIGFGKNTGGFTFGVITVFQYWQKSAADTTGNKNERIIGGGAPFFQWDLEYFYFRVTAGGYKFLDAASNNTSYLKQFIPFASLRLGFPLTDDALLSTQLEYTFPRSASYNSFGFNGTLATSGQVALTVTIAARF